MLFSLGEPSSVNVFSKYRAVGLTLAMIGAVSDITAHTVLFASDGFEFNSDYLASVRSPGWTGALSWRRAPHPICLYCYGVWAQEGGDVNAPFAATTRSLRQGSAHMARFGVITVALRSTFFGLFSCFTQHPSSLKTSGSCFFHVKPPPDSTPVGRERRGRCRRRASFLRRSGGRDRGRYRAWPGGRPCRRCRASRGSLTRAARGTG